MEKRGNRPISVTEIVRGGCRVTFEVTRIQERDLFIEVKLRGRITLGEGSSVVLRDTIKRLLNEGKRSILLDLTDVSYIDSSGIGELVSAFRSIHKEDGKLRLRVSEKLREQLRAVKLYSSFDFEIASSSGVPRTASPAALSLIGGGAIANQTQKTFAWSMIVLSTVMIIVGLIPLRETVLGFGMTFGAAIVGYECYLLLEACK